MIDDIQVDKQSKIGQLRAQLDKLREPVQGLQALLTTHRAERDERQAFINRATLKSDPMELAGAQIRIGLLEKAIAAVSAELAPRLETIDQTSAQLAEATAQYERAARVITTLSDLTDDFTRRHTIGDWLIRLSQARQQVAAMVEAPGSPTLEPVISVRFDVVSEPELVAA